MKQFPVVAASVLLCLPLLAGCSGLREAAGLTKKSPDEFAVTTKAPLVVPPNFNLRPPTPGAPPTQQADPSTRAEMALFNQQDPETVARGMTGNFTMAEKLLLAHAGAQDADPAVRTKLLSDIRAMQAANTSFTDRVLGAAPTPYTGQPVNADSEIGKRAKKSQTKAVAPKNDDSGGWFDWF